MKRMSEAKRQVLLATEALDWKGIVSMAEAFTAEYEAAAAAQTEEAPLPFMSPSGWWLQSYGFSKACLAAFSQVLSREEPSILSVTCSPGWVATEMSSTYGRRGHAHTRAAKSPLGLPSATEPRSVRWGPDSSCRTRAASAGWRTDDRSYVVQTSTLSCDR